MTMKSPPPSSAMINPKVATYQIVSRSRSLTRRWSPTRDELASVAEAISGSAYRLNQLDGKIVVDLPSQTPDQHFEDVGERIVILIPDVGGDCRAVDDLAGVQHEELQQGELLGGKLDLGAGAPHSLRVEVDLQIGDAEGLGKW